MKRELYKDGLTIRDHFAGRAEQAIITGLLAGNQCKLQQVKEAAKEIAATAHVIADAMLEESGRNET